MKSSIFSKCACVQSANRALIDSKLLLLDRFQEMNDDFPVELEVLKFLLHCARVSRFS
jgi:hypothetical protein